MFYCIIAIHYQGLDIFLLQGRSWKRELSDQSNNVDESKKSRKDMLDESKVLNSSTLENVFARGLTPSRLIKRPKMVILDII